MSHFVSLCLNISEFAIDSPAWIAPPPFHGIDFTICREFYLDFVTEEEMHILCHVFFDVAYCRDTQTVMFLKSSSVLQLISSAIFSFAAK